MSAGSAVRNGWKADISQARKSLHLDVGVCLEITHEPGADR